MTEADLCALFLKSLPKGWTAYPETHGWDILLSRDQDGFQIGVQAKLVLNAKAICQAAETISSYDVTDPGPDCRAVLVPSGKERSDFAELLKLLGIVTLTLRRGYKALQIWPALPRKDQDYGPWREFLPERRYVLPDYIPDVQAGVKSPLMLTPRKVKAIKLQILLETRGYTTRQDFHALKLSMSLYTQLRWLRPARAIRNGGQASCPICVKPIRSTSSKSSKTSSGGARSMSKGPQMKNPSPDPPCDSNCKSRTRRVADAGRRSVSSVKKCREMLKLQSRLLAETFAASSV